MKYSQLNSREKEIVTLIAQGYSNEEISSIIHLNVRSICEAINNIKKKWKVSSRVQLGIIAYHIKLLDANNIYKRYKNRWNGEENEKSSFHRAN